MGTTQPETIRVLHVDDEPDLAELVATFLTRTDGRLEVVSEFSAREGLDRLFESAEQFDCVISDYDMPGMNGQEFLEAVRERQSELPFILFTGKGSEEIASRAISAGVTDYLRKGSGTEQYKLLANQIDQAVSRWRMESQLQKVQKQADVLLEDSPVMITVSVDGECTFINRAGVELLGATSRYDVVGTNYLDLVQPVESTHEDEAIFLPEAAENEGVSNIERRLTTLGGERKYVEVTARSITFDGQDAVLAIAKDITARKQRVAELEQREQQYRALADNFPQGLVFLFDEDLRYTVARGRGLSDVGLDTYQLEGQTVEEALPETLRELFEPLYRRALEGEEDVFELEYDGHVFRVHTLPVRDKDDTVIGGMQIAPEITEERRQADELRTRNERLTEFTSVISHDLRNPLQIARGNVGIARAACDSDALRKTDVSLERMESLIQRMLELARSGLVIDAVEPVSLRAVVDDAWKQVAAGTTTIAVDGDVTVDADESRLRELFGNLFKNAVDHGETGSTVRVGPLADGFYVEDDGVGIPIADRERVFETGFSTTVDGTGFGLAIVRQIAKAHGWTIDAEAGTNGGTRFAVTGVAVR